MARGLIRRSGQVRAHGRTIEYTLFRVPRRRHVHLVVDDDAGLQVRAPWHFSEARARALVSENGEWVAHALATARGRIAHRPRLVSGSRLRLLDEELELEVASAAQLDLLATGASGARSAPAGAALRTREGTVVRSGKRITVETFRLAAPSVGPLLEAWFRREARDYLPSRLSDLGRPLGLSATAVTVRGQKTRWGSCSAKGRISLNWRLMQLPSALADYVLVHELCHLVHLNHSARFWSLVESALPDFHDRRARLRALQPTLAL